MALLALLAAIGVFGGNHAHSAPPLVESALDRITVTAVLEPGF